MSSNNKRPFIVIDSIDAAGSSTQVDRLVRKLKSKKYKPLQLHFPQENRPTGKFVYEKYLLAKNKANFSKREQSLIYIQDFYSRKEDIEAHLKLPNSVVVTDRFYSSTLAYQSSALSGEQRKRMLSWIMWICAEGKFHLPRPDLVFVLDSPIELSLARLKNQKKDYHETKNKLSSFRKNYLRLAQEQKWIVINNLDSRGEQRSINNIHEEIWQYVKPLL